MNQAEPNKQQPTAPATPVAAPRRNWRPVLFLLLCLVGSSVASFLVFRYMAPRLPRELIGLWQVQDGGLKGATLEFRWYGTSTATMFKDGKKLTVDSSVKFEDNQLFLTSKDERTGRPDTVIQTILKLTKDELVIRDVDRNTYRMTRVDE